MVSDEDINWHLSQTVNVKLTAQQLIAAANQAGGEDNITVAIIEVLEKPIESNTGAKPSIWKKMKNMFK